ncbi:TonB-dependent receptor [Wenzhouxiangella sp. XN201]|uniref:TonB-dependent receptor domain-containing protein n=1 Tax=Wenzhouxiangella sp. XN201 TaxID=2710755 RepID=UPI0013C8E8CE|nr:TonB-dependent receptor [Wenzhouxiangella sp. XN201]NEZ03495.1 TonB-dependent receptor [Wenzhouxiangella sp. XN201]
MMSLLKRKKLVTATWLALLASAGLAVAPVWAQDQDADEETAAEEQEEQVDELERVTVTGSLIRRDEFTSASPIQVITADTQVQMGQVDTAEFLQSSSVAAGSTQLNNQFAGFVVEGGTGVNTLSLRGLGAQRTLVVLNNRRPGAAGTRGQVGAFDLNVIPSSIIQRAEILKDGASSIYGSDAVAGVVNVITRRSVDSPELSVRAAVPLEGGGETYDVSGAYGLNFDSGSIVFAGEYQLRESLTVGERDFLRCGRDRITDGEGRWLDRRDRSTLQGTELANCPNLYANTAIDAVFGDRYIPSPDGVTIGLMPGYRPRQNGTFANSPHAFYEDWLNFPFTGSATAINRQERSSFYASSNFDLDFLGGVEWNTEWLATRRETEARGWRQFFPLTGGTTALIPSFQYPGNDTFFSPVPSGIALPVMPYPSNTDVQVDFYYFATGLQGDLNFGNNWTWSLDTSYSYSDGDYTRNSIVASRSGDIQFDPDGPDVNYFDPCFLSGDCMDQLIDAVGANHTGNTIYDQFVLNGIITGDLFDVPAGPVGAALGVEYRTFSIDDQPSQLTLDGDLWGESSAGRTKGDDTVKEIFGEIEVPILAGRPFFEELTFNGSVRSFDYDSSGTDVVWKAGLNWQMTPSLRLRGSKGTSYRSPALFELFLADQTAFAGQLAIDPCIEWGDSSNENIRRNCAAVGIPSDFPGDPISATIVSGGGLGVLEPETSSAETLGFILTPTFVDFSLAVDYFEIEVNDQVSQLGGGSIVGGCYGAPVFPNNFCNLFDRNPGDHPDRPFAITEVRDSYINVNRQFTKGVDTTVRFDHAFATGDLVAEVNATWVLEDVQQLFDPGVADGFETVERVGTIGRPKLVGNSRVAFSSGDLTYTWFTDYVRETSNESLGVNETFTYFGFEGAQRTIEADSAWYHGVSVFYEQPRWTFLLGVRNMFDQNPPRISSGVAARRGEIPLSATQYDLRGRTAYARINFLF